MICGEVKPRYLTSDTVGVTLLFSFTGGLSCGVKIQN